TYNFVANYYGGTGNDLVLQWAGNRALAWGYNGDGELGDGTTTQRNTAVSVTATGVLAGKTILSLAMGAKHSLALCSDGTLAAWGANTSGQLGDNTTTDRLAPVMVNNSIGISALYGKTVIAIAAGQSHSLALCSDGTVVAWGENLYYQLGDTTTTQRNAPAQVNRSSGISALFGKTVVAVAAGARHNLALCSDGSVAAWGANTSGQLGDNTTSPRSAAVAVNAASGLSALNGRSVVAVAAGGLHSLALCTDGAVMAWGNDINGELGDDNAAQFYTNSPVAVAVMASSGSALFGKSVVSIMAGYAHSMAQCSDGSLVAWGSNAFGQLGDTTTNNGYVPVTVSTASGVSALNGKTVSAISAGARHSMAQCTDGTLTAWGLDTSGQLGNNSTTGSSAPVAVSTSPLTAGEVFVRAAGGPYALHTLALTAAPLPIPTALTLAATAIGTTSATLNGTLNASGVSTAASFDLGTTTAYGLSLAAAPGTITGSSNTPVSTLLTGLSPGVTYHFRAKAVNGAGTINGADLTFTTLNNDATLSGLSASSGTLAPAFTSSGNNYTTAVSSDTTSITVTPTATDSNASLRVNGTPLTSGSPSSPISLSYGENTISVLVTATDTVSTWTYTLTVTRPSPPTWPIAFASASDVPMTANGYSAIGAVNVSLNYAPAPGTTLTVVNNTSLGFISGTFSNLTQGQLVNLTYNGVTYPFVASYYGGTGNDLVLIWAYSRLMAWGNNGVGQIGDGTTTHRRFPVAVPTAGAALDGLTPLGLTAGAGHSLALCSDGSLFAWGFNSEGQLGNNSLTDTTVPGMVSTIGTPLQGKVVVAVSAGAVHNLALCSDGTLVGWGNNGDGQLANPIESHSMLPVDVVTAGTPLAGRSVAAIGAGNFHSLVLCTDGTLVAWGRNDSGELGNQTTTARSRVPVAVTTAGTPLAGRSVVSIAAGGYHNIALCDDGTIVTWGSNENGQLGNNSLTNSNVPVAVTTVGTVLAGKTVVAVDAGYCHCLALCSDGTLVAWGSNEYGQLGIGGTTNSKVPVAVNTSIVLAGKTIASMNAGGPFSMVRCSDGTVAAWGYNADGELGSNSTVNSSLPVAVGSGRNFMRVVAGPNAYHSFGLVATSSAAETLPSSDATLSGLAVSTGALNTPFNSSTSSYLVVLDSTVTSITITPTVNESHASITVNGQAVASGTATSAIPLVPGVGGNPIQVTVTAQDGYSQAQYFVFVACLSKVEQWRLQAFGAPFDSGPAADTADADNDGICNLLEFALNLSPATASKLPVSSAINGGNYEYTYTRSTAAANAGTTFTVEWNATLSAASWSSSGVTQTVLSDDGTTQQVKAVLPMNGASTMFVHLSVTAPP
ncbi:MAG: cadherin-like beta sandwich domain-containing protein, partial [Prosthecobacter sp.]|uniref:RCC1 domain-containing protein n=1 Tax=Prosthecobacter sp. TaxID=1965333 RepID=UPI003BAE6EC8